MTLDEVEAKFRKCLDWSFKPFSEEKANQIIKMTRNIEQLDDVTKLIRLLVP